MSYNLFRNAKIRNSTQCRNDSNLGYSVYWDTDNDFKKYTLFEGVTARLVSNGSYFMVSTTSSGFISTSEDIVSIDAGVYTKLRVNMRVDPGMFHTVPTLGRIQFRTSDDVVWEPEKAKDFTIIPDNAYREYEIDLSIQQNWQGDIVRLRLFPFLDGDAGQQIFVKSIEAFSPTVFSCASRFDTPVCNRFADYFHICPFRGSGARATSISVPDRLTITKEVNDKIIVNINGFGNQSITLNPVLNAEISKISSDIEYKLNLIGVGGYSGATVDIVNNKFVIETDTPEALSTIVISEPESSSAGNTLGFFDSSGNPVYTVRGGEEAASRYEPEGSFRVGKTELNRFYSNSSQDEDGLFSIVPFRWSPQGGREDYLNISREVSLDFKGKTFIDYNNPISENGVITKAFFNGIAHTETEFRVYRQLLDGSIHYVSGINFGNTIDNNSGKLFEVDCSIRVRKGDLLGIYSASLYTGKDTENLSFSYFLYDGDLVTSASSLQLTGYGESGAPIFCRGSFRANKAVVTFEFEDLEPVESIEINADEDTPIEEIKLTDVLAGGLNGGPSVTGYTGYGRDNSKAPEWTGLSAITDKDKLNVNHVSPVAYPLWIDGVDPTNFDFTEAGIILDFAPGIDVLFDIYKVIVYFRGERNIKHFSLDYPQNTNLLGTIRTWQQVSPRFSEVYIDGLLSPETRYFYKNPAWVTVNDYSEDYINLKYRFIEFIFSEIKSRAVRFRGFLNRDSSAVDYTSTTLADFPIYIDPAIQEIEVYAKSVPNKNLSDNFYLFSSIDGLHYTELYDKDSLSSSLTRITVGYPIKFLKLVIKPTSTLTVNSLFGNLSIEETNIVTNLDYPSEHLLNSPKNLPIGEISKIEVINNTEEISNYYVDIVEENRNDSDLVLWNKLGSPEEVENSEYGPGGIVFKRPNFKLNIHNVALNAPAYVMDTNFLYNSPCYISYNLGSTWERLGQTVVNGSLLDYVTNGTSFWNQYGKVYIAIDTKDLYDFEEVKLVSANIGIHDFGWDNVIFYSSANVSLPSNIPNSGPLSWSTNSLGVRWIRISVDSIFPPGDKSLAFIVPILNPTSNRNKGKIPWKLESRLTNGISGSTLSFPEEWAVSNRIKYYCVDLQNRFDINGISLGPLESDFPIDSDFFISDTNELDSNKSSSNISFSGTITDDPNRVVWSNFGVPTSGSDRWVMVRSNLCDEIGVFVYEDTSINKSLFETSRWWTSSLSSPFVDRNNYCVPFGSIAVEYPENSSYIEYLQCQVPLGFDNELRQRDAFSFCFYIDNVDSIDKTYGYFRLGKGTTETSSFNLQNPAIDSDNFYVWDFDTVSSGIVSGWNFITLQFFKINEVGDTRFIENLSGSTDSFKKRSRVHNFRFQFRGKGEGRPFKIAVDNFEIVRSFYPESVFGSGLYLAGSDYLKFPLNDFNHTQGALEFFLDSDWSKNNNCNNCTDMVSNTLFRFVNPFGYYMCVVMSTSGLEVFISNGDNVLTHHDDSYGSIVAGQRTHIAFVWDFRGDSKSLFQFYINGVLSSEFFRSSLQSSFDLRGMSSTYLIFGGKTWEGFSTREISGLDGVIDNVKLYNYAKKDFSDITTEGIIGTKKSEELLQLSSDGVNFYGYEDRGIDIPILIRNVLPGQRFYIYVRPRGISGLKDMDRNRQSFIEIVRSLPG